MVKVKPFKAFLARQEAVSNVISLPYDVLSTAEAREDAKENPMSFYHVNKPEIDLDDDVEDKRTIYEQGRKNLLHFIDEGYLVEDSEDRVYIYGQKMGEH